MDTLVTDKPHILFVGQDCEGSNATSCRRAFIRLGCRVTGLNEREFFPPWRSLQLRVVRRILQQSVIREFNEAFVEAVPALRPDVVFVFKGVMLHAASLAHARRLGARLFIFYPDPDPVADYQRFRNNFLDCVPIYDCIFTPKRYHFGLLMDAGAQRIEFSPYAYDTGCHTPIAPTADDQRDYGTDVAVVATWRACRAAMLEQLVQTGFPYRLAIWGNQWERLAGSSPLRPFVKFRAVNGIEMARAFACSKIALAFLTPPDLHTARSFEIPAFGTLMLAERTSEHLEFFREDEEIACFGDVAELRANIDYYMAHEDQRVRVAEAGRRRVVQGGHDYEARMARVLEVYREITGSCPDCPAIPAKAVASEQPWRGPESAQSSVAPVTGAESHAL